jgi:hypothetical protein
VCSLYGENGFAGVNVFESNPSMYPNRTAYTAEYVRSLLLFDAHSTAQGIELTVPTSIQLMRFSSALILVAAVSG